MKRYVALVACLLPTGAIADEPFEGYTERYAEVVNHVSCFPHGIDRIGAGEIDEGMEIWSQCWGDDLVSRLNFVGASIVCPGEQCMFLADQPDLRGPAMRAGLAMKGFEMAGYTATHHQLDTLRVEFDGPGNATVDAMITATHFSDHQGPETHFIHWTGTLVDTQEGWRITEEDLSTAGFSVLPQSTE